MPDLLEKLAELEHEQWIHWTSYFLANFTPENHRKWLRQIKTPYAGLTEQEKESDRAWARKVLEVVSPLRAEAERLQQTIARVLEQGPPGYRDFAGTDYWTCAYCHRPIEVAEHAPGCPWLELQQIGGAAPERGRVR
jgi:hypothetical protein